MSKLEDRRKNALDRLETQLKSGVKTQKKSTKTTPLTDGDKKRIQSEITTLIG